MKLALNLLFKLSLTCRIHHNSVSLFLEYLVITAGAVVDDAGAVVDDYAGASVYAAWDWLFRLELCTL